MPWIEERPTKDGKTHYRVYIRIKGHESVTETFHRKTDAVRWAQQTESSIRQGIYFKTAEAKKHTFKELCEYYEKKQLPLKSRSKQEAQVKWWKEQLGHHLLSDITPALITKFRDQLESGITVRGQQRSPSTVVRYLACLSHIFTISVKDLGWVEENPVLKIKKPKEPRGRVRFLNEDERKRLLDFCQASSNPFLYTIVVLAISTGMRQGEIMHLVWEDVDLDRKRIVLHETKNGERRVVPLIGYALGLVQSLLQQKRIHSKYLFPNEKGNKPIDIRSAWEYALKKAEISDFKFHDLRHTAASYLIMNGASIAEIAEILGHKTLQMVKRYAHHSEAHTAGVVEKMNEKIFGLCN